MDQLTYGDVEQAAHRISGRVRPVALAETSSEEILTAHGDPADRQEAEPCRIWLALEYLQYTGSFKARGAQNFLAAHRDAGTLPGAGVTIASGGNAGLACAWAARQQGVPATVFLPETAPQVKVTALRGYGAEVRLVGTEYAEALAACTDFAAATGALASHAYDHPLIAAGAGTLLDEIRRHVPELDTVIVAVGGGGLFAGVAAAAHRHGLRVVAVEPENCRALNAAVEAGRPVDVPVDSIAADSLGARRTSAMALHAARRDDVSSVLVPDSEIVRARQTLWDHHRIAVEYGAATALASLTAPLSRRLPDRSTATSGPAVAARAEGGYRPAKGENVCVVLCGANTELRTLAGPAGPS